MGKGELDENRFENKIYWWDGLAEVGSENCI